MRPRGYLAGLLLLFIVAGCAGGGTPTPPPTAGLATPGPGSPLPASRCPEVPEPTGTLCFEVVIRDFAFDPPTITIPTSARVVFVNEDGTAHSIAWADGTPTSVTLATGDSTERVFSSAVAGTLAYGCGIHPSMKGSIVVDATLPVP